MGSGYEDRSPFCITMPAVRVSVRTAKTSVQVLMSERNRLHTVRFVEAEGEPGTASAIPLGHVAP